MQWSGRRFEHKVLEKVSCETTIGQVDISNLVIQLEEILKTIHSLYMKLCDVESFTLKNQCFIDLLHVDMQESVVSMGRKASSRSLSYNKLIFSE